MFYQLALLSLLASTGSPQSLDTYGSGKLGPRGHTATEFDELLGKNADAEGRYPLDGPNVSSPYTDSSQAPIPGWAWTVSTKADVSIPRDNKTFTGTRLALEVPDAKNMHGTWQLCVLEWRGDPENYPAALRDDDGSCSSVLSQECIRDVQAAVVKGYKVPSGNTACACPSIADIGSCGSAEAKQALTGGGACQARTFNATQIRDWPDGKFTVMQYGGRAQDPGNRTDYDRIGSMAWPVLVLWGYSRNQTGAFVVRDEAKLSCVRARNATSASTLGAPNPKDSSGQMGVPGVASLFLSMGVVLVAVLM